jgi:hypothetical protein
MPFWGDQALFTLYGRQLTQGAVLYRDIFDVKQPGIFIFYALGGSLFGFSEVGIHLFELAYWLAFSVFALVALRPYFTTRWGPPLVPVFTVVVYYLYAAVLDLTQIEILVAFPLLVAWWLIDQAVPGTSRGLKRYAGAGLAAAAVVLLKHLYLLIILAFLAHAVRRARRSGVPSGDIGRSLSVFLIALVIPLLVVVTYFAAHGQLERIWWIHFELAPKAQLVSDKRLIDLRLGARRFMIGHAPILALAALGSVHALRQQKRPQPDLATGMVLWGAAGAVAFLIQGWWEYKWLLFTIPVGILAVVGVEPLVALAADLGKKPRWLAVAAGTALATLSFVSGAPVPQVQTRLLFSVVIGVGAGIGAQLLVNHPRISQAMLHIAAAFLAVSVGVAAIGPAYKLRVLREHRFALTLETRKAFWWFWSEFYQRIDEDLDVLGSRLSPGPLHVFGDPVFLLRANRPQGLPFLGLRPEFYDGRLWRELYSDLRSTLPATIIVDPYIGSVIRSRYPAIMDFIESRYEVALVGASGTWYVLR